MVALSHGEFILGDDLDVFFDFCDDEWLDEDPQIYQQLMSIEEEVSFMHKSIIKSIIWEISTLESLRLRLAILFVMISNWNLRIHCGFLHFDCQLKR